MRRFRTPAVPTSPLVTTSLPNLPLFRTGKVRDVYDLGDSLLIVATDRISAFDYILATGIPDKGRVLTQLSAFWFQRLAHVIANHFVTMDVEAYPPAVRAHAADLRGRSMLVRKTAPIEIECVARGYLSGSGWKEYRETGRICGIVLPPGLRESDRLPAPIFTPATKAASGHDINIDEAEATERLKDAALFATPPRHHPRAVSASRGARRRLRDSAGRHEVRIRLRRPHAAAHRRGADTRFVAVLAGGPVLARRAAAQLRQAVRARLPRGDRVEQTAARPGVAGRRRRPHPREVHRRVRAPDGTPPVRVGAHCVRL